MIYKIYNESSSLKDSDFDITSDIIAFMSEANQISSSIYESIIENAYSEAEEDPEAWLYESYDIFNEGVIDFIKGIVSKIVNAIKKAILFVKEKILGIKAKNAEDAVAKAKDPNSDEKITVMKVEFDKLASDIEKAFDDPEKLKDENFESKFREDLINKFKESGDYVTAVELEKKKGVIQRFLKKHNSDAERFASRLVKLSNKVEKDLPGKLEKLSKESYTDDTTDKEKKADSKANAAAVGRVSNVMIWMLNYSVSRIGAISFSNSEKMISALGAKELSKYNKDLNPASGGD